MDMAKMKTNSILYSFFVFCFVLIGCTEQKMTVLELTDDKITIVLGESYQLNPQVTPEGAQIMYSSDNLSVASVDENGLITANSIGNANVTVTANEASVSCEVDVIGQPAEQISLNITDVRLLIGDTVRLTALVMPEDTYNKVIEWDSDNASVAEVDESGLVTAVSVGNAVITASVDDVQAECTVKVVEVPAVGDYYYADGTYSSALYASKDIIGIVFYVNEDQMSGKIVEMGEASLVWGEPGIELDNYNRYDGKGNTDNIIKYISDNDAWDNFPAFRYIDSLDMGGLDWYLPSTVELKQIYCAMSGVKWVPENAQEGECNDWEDLNTAILTGAEYVKNRETFNARITDVGGVALNVRGYSYFASTSMENDRENIWQIMFHSGAGYNMVRSGTNRVRGIAEF